MNSTKQPTHKALDSAVDSTGDLGRSLMVDISGLPWGAIDSLLELRLAYRGLQTVNPSRQSKMDVIGVGARLLASILDPEQGVAWSALPSNVQSSARALLGQLAQAGFVDEDGRFSGWAQPA